MSGWLLALLAFVPPFALAAGLALLGRTSARLAAAELAISLGTLMLVLASFAWPRDELIDLPLALGLLAVPGTLLFAHYLERWL